MSANTPKLHTGWAITDVQKGKLRTVAEYQNTVIYIGRTFDNLIFYETCSLYEQSGGTYSMHVARVLLPKEISRKSSCVTVVDMISHRIFTNDKIMTLVLQSTNLANDFSLYKLEKDIRWGEIIKLILDPVKEEIEKQKSCVIL